MQYFYALLWLLFVHWVADFVLQSDLIAQNKSKSNAALSVHVITYTITLMFGAVALLHIIEHRGGLMIGNWLLVNSIAHFATDYVTSRINARLYEKHRHYFYVMFGFDQLIHCFTLALTMVWLLKP